MFPSTHHQHEWQGKFEYLKAAFDPFSVYCWTNNSNEFRNWLSLAKLFYSRATNIYDVVEEQSMNLGAQACGEPVVWLSSVLRASHHGGLRIWTKKEAAFEFK